jgi:hypothetical protein
LKVLSLTLPPLFDSHSALAVRIRCQLAFMAAGIPSRSFSVSGTALRPRPGLVYKPDNPSVLYRPTRLFTLMLLMPVMLPAALEMRPSDLSGMLWQRIRKPWLPPSFKPASNALRCADARKGVFSRPIMETRVITTNVTHNKKKPNLAG